MLAQTWSCMYFRQHLERFMDVQYIHLLSLMAFFVFHIFGRISLLTEQTAERHTDNPHVSLFCPSAFWIDQFDRSAGRWAWCQTVGKKWHSCRWDGWVWAPLTSSWSGSPGTISPCFSHSAPGDTVWLRSARLFPEKKQKKQPRFIVIIEEESFLINNGRDARIFVEFLNQQRFFHKINPPKITITFCLFDK